MFYVTKRAIKMKMESIRGHLLSEFIDLNSFCTRAFPSFSNTKCSVMLFTNIIHTID